MNIYSSDLIDRRIGTPLTQVHYASKEPLLDNLENIIKSNHNVALDSGDFTVEVQHVTNPEARGYSKQRAFLVNKMDYQLNEILHKTHALQEIDRDMDPFCAALALLCAKEYYDLKSTNAPVLHFDRKFKTGRKLRMKCRHLFRRAKLSTCRCACRSIFKVSLTA